MNDRRTSSIQSQPAFPPCGGRWPEGPDEGATGVARASGTLTSKPRLSPLIRPLRGHLPPRGGKAVGFPIGGILFLVLFLVAATSVRAQDAPAPPASDDLSVVVTGASQDDFPKIGVQFELRKPDGTFVRDATKDEFRVTEEGQERPILDFQAPLTKENVPTTIVLVVDRSGSMNEEAKLASLKGAVARFLEKIPQGSKIAVIAFSSQVELIRPFTTDRVKVGKAVDELFADGPTRFYDAVAMALKLLEDQTGRRVIVALTDGLDTSSSTPLEDDVASGQQLGLPIYTLGFGNEREIDVNGLKQLAAGTRGEYYPARRAEELRKVYEAIAERLGAGYSLTYQSDRRIPDGTLRPVQVIHRGSRKVGETAVFIPGMVVPAAGWSPLFLILAAGLAALAFLPSLTRRAAEVVKP
ncbi:vWA domain-containing protein [Paludisphaera rhizosphaerae]|uniref:vWA domain-containing protein n=1 Tax=Paludisphaera rhizosphaerae TaxID=2711216 RepID=UPI0013EE3C91|nr:VWA domain-containing protein [Paludisphaera rhizosphaerae]